MAPKGKASKVADAEVLTVDQQAELSEHKRLTGAAVQHSVSSVSLSNFACLGTPVSSDSLQVLAVSRRMCPEPLAPSKRMCCCCCC